jgi:hypothetical protein
MRAKKAPEIIEIPRSEKRRRVLRSISGSDDEDFSYILSHQVLAALWQENSDSDERTQQTGAALAAMMGMKRRDEHEGMLIAQLLATSPQPRYPLLELLFFVQPRAASPRSPPPSPHELARPDAMTSKPETVRRLPAGPRPRAGKR